MNNTINSELATIYREWLEATKRPNGIFCDKSGVEKFSNPYFFGVSDEWNIEKDGVRILVVGQEGASGHWNAIDMNSDKYIAFDEVEKLQEASIATVEKRVGGKDASIDICGEKHLIKNNHRAFWQFFNRIATNDKAVEACPCAWTNIDLVCYNQKAANRKYKLNETDRKILHADTIPTIFKRLADIAKPTHIVFASWRDVSFDHEFESKPSGFFNDSFKRNGVNSVLLTHLSNIPCLVLYHPQYLKIKKSFDDVIKTICDYIYDEKKDENLIETSFKLG